VLGLLQAGIEASGSGLPSLPLPEPEAARA